MKAPSPFPRMQLQTLSTLDPFVYNLSHRPKIISYKYDFFSFPVYISIKFAVCLQLSIQVVVEHQVAFLPVCAY